MSLKEKIFLQLSAATGDLSGEALAEAFGVSRVAVWKAIRALRAEGFEIVSSTKRGYRLVGNDSSSLSPLSLSAELGGLDVIRLKRTASTNGYCLARAFSAPALVLADEQTGGQARRGGTFPSPAGGVYMSYVFFPPVRPDEVAALNERATQATARVLSAEAREQEIYRDGKKIAGVLTEVTADMDSVKQAIVGVGVLPAGVNGSKRETIVKIAKELQKL